MKKCIILKGRRKGEQGEIVKIEGPYAIVKVKGKERKYSVRNLEYV